MSYKAKLLLGATLAFIIIISSIMTALSLLKEEAVNNYLTISELNAKTFSKELNQDLHNIEQTILNIQSLLQTPLQNSYINDRLKQFQSSYPQIRSINISYNNIIIYSSNAHNIELNVQLNNLYPKPIFDDEILQVSTPWIGRDFTSGNDILNYDGFIDNKETYFLPISKKIKVRSHTYQVIINLNTDYFINRFSTSANSKNILFELIRLDGLLLLSSNPSQTIGKYIKSSELFDKVLEQNQITGIESVHGNKSIATYILTEDYPISLSVKLDYEQNLMSWNKKQYHFFVITTLIVIISIAIALIFFFLYHKKREKEIELHQLQIQDQKKFKLLFEDSHFLAAVMNKDGTLLELNNPALKFLNMTSIEIKDKKFWELHCFDIEEQAKLQTMIATFDKKNIEEEIIAYNARHQKRIFEMTVSSIIMDDEPILIAMGIDITQKKEKENSLKQAYTVFDNTRDGIMITNSATQIINVNKAFESITGYSKNEILMMKSNILRSGCHSTHFYKNMWKSIVENGYWEGEITNLNKKGEHFTEWLTINVIFDEEGRVLNYIGVFSDITEQKAREQSLKEKDEVLYQQSKMAAMGEMIANIAHQWRQPLSLISSAATSMIVQKSVGVSTKEEELKTLETINESTKYLSKTIDDFRNFLKADKELTLFEVDEAISEAISLTNLKINHEAIYTIMSIQKVKAYGIKNEFMQVIINILNNAKDALKNSENKLNYIFVDVYNEDGFIYINIKDNAGGIANDIINRVFEPYFTTKHQSQGTGIGLYMSEEIIKNHMHGVLTVQNEEYCYKEEHFKGACFTIKLPLK